jgi:hypothetical protein
MVTKDALVALTGDLGFKLPNSRERGTPFTHLLGSMSQVAASGDMPALKKPIRWIVGQREPRPRGRPPGTGHPKIKKPLPIPVTELDLSKLKRAGLAENDIGRLYKYMETGTFVAVAKAWGVTPQAMHQRFHEKIFPALKKVNPKFQYQTFRDCVRDRLSSK